MFYFYAVKNLDTGKYLCRVPQSINDINANEIWSDRAQKIKFYSMPGPARGAITKIARLCVLHQTTPQNISLVQFDTNEVILDESQRVSKAIEKIQSANQKSQMMNDKHRVESLKRERDRIEQQLKSLGVN